MSYFNDLAEPGGPWRPTFAPGRLEMSDFSYKDAGHPRFYRFRALSSFQFSLEHSLVSHKVIVKLGTTFLSFQMLGPGVFMFQCNLGKKSCSKAIDFGFLYELWVFSLPCCSNVFFCCTDSRV